MYKVATNLENIYNWQGNLGLAVTLAVNETAAGHLGEVLPMTPIAVAVPLNRVRGKGGKPKYLRAGGTLRRQTFMRPAKGGAGRRTARIIWNTVYAKRQHFEKTWHHPGKRRYNPRKGVFFPQFANDPSGRKAGRAMYATSRTGRDDNSLLALTAQRFAMNLRRHLFG